MGSEREPIEREAVRDLQESEGADLGVVQGDNPGLDAASLSEQVADSVVGEGYPFLPIESLKQQVATLLVYASRVDGSVGSFLGIASAYIKAAVERYEREYGEFATGPAPEYEG